MPSIAAKSNASDNATLYLAAAIVVVLLVSLAAAWFYVQSQPRLEVRAAFVDTGPMIVSVDGYNIATRMSVQTSKADGDWASRNRSALIQAMQNALTTSNPQTMQTPQGLQALQSSLTEAGNNAMKTGKIQNVLLTEFLIQPAE